MIQHYNMLFYTESSAHDLHSLIHCILTACDVFRW